jgi:hypothetical protein
MSFKGFNFDLIFQIDKRSSYGIGHHNRPGMACRPPAGGLSYQPRRIRSKSIITPETRPHPIPSTSSHTQYAKSNQHRNHRNPDPSTNLRHGQQQSTSEHTVAITNSLHLNSQHVPVIHSVYPRNEITINNIVTDSTESTRSNGFHSSWQIQIIGGLCIFLAITLVILKLYYDNELTGLQLLYFIVVTILFLISTTTISILRILRMRRQNFAGERRVIEPVNNQMTLQSLGDGLEPPPPYAVAINFPEKHYPNGYNNDHASTPPPSYEKINMMNIA